MLKSEGPCWCRTSSGSLSPNRLRKKKEETIEANDNFKRRGAADDLVFIGRRPRERRRKNLASGLA